MSVLAKSLTISCCVEALRHSRPCILSMNKSLTLLTFLGLSNLAYSEETQPDSPWKVTGAASLAHASGNSDSASHSLQLSAKYAKDKNEVFLGADWLYSESNGDTSTDSFRIQGQYNRQVTERFFHGINGSYFTDRVADLDYRTELGLSLGYYLIKNDDTSLSLEAGLGMAWEEQGGESNDLVISRFAQRFEHQLSKRAKIWQSIAFTPKFDDFNDYNLIAEAGIDTTISQHWALRSSVRYQYDSSPAAGRQSDDTTLLMGLSYSLGGFDDVKLTGSKSIANSWITATSLGFGLNSGNSESKTIGLSFDSSYRESKREVLLSSKYNFAENDNSTDTDTLRANAQYNHFFGERSYLGAGLGYLRNQLSDISYRITPSVTFGHYLVKEDDMTLSVEAGPGVTFEKVGGITDDYFSISAAEKYTWSINENTEFKQSLSAILDPSNSDNYSIAADAQLNLKISAILSWQITATWTYDNAPAVDRGKDDTTVSTGISLKF